MLPSPCTAVAAAALPWGPQPPVPAAVRAPSPALASRSGPHPGCRAENNARGCVRFPGRKREAPTNVVWIRRRHGLAGGRAAGGSARPRCAPDGIWPPAPSPRSHGRSAPCVSSAAPEPWPCSSSSLAAPSRPCCGPSRSPSRGHGRPLPASAAGSWRHRTPAAPGPHQHGTRHGQGLRGPRGAGGQCQEGWAGRRGLCHRGVLGA